MLKKMSRSFCFLLVFVVFLLEQFETKSIRRYDECEEFFHQNDCYFFPCLDAHYRCGRESHLVRFSYNLCELPRRKYSLNLTENARKFFNHTNRCAMVSLRDQLVDRKISGTFTCADLQQMIFRIFVKCFQNQQKKLANATVLDFCSIVCENLQTFVNLFLNLNDSFININDLLFQTGQNCGAQLVESPERTVPSLLISICLDRKNVQLKNDITKVMTDPRFEFKDYEWG